MASCKSGSGRQSLVAQNKPHLSACMGVACTAPRTVGCLAALRAAKLLVPENSEIDPPSADGIPMFNEDDEKRPPSSVLELKKRIRSANSVLIVTPEYNYSIPGILKNAIDWASRPHGDSAWSGNRRRSWVRLSAQSEPLGPNTFAADFCSSQLVSPLNQP